MVKTGDTFYFSSELSAVENINLLILKGHIDGTYIDADLYLYIPAMEIFFTLDYIEYTNINLIKYFIIKVLWKEQIIWIYGDKEAAQSLKNNTQKELILILK